MSYDRHVRRLWQTPIRDYWRTTSTSSMTAFLRAGSLRNRRNRLNCDVYGPSRKIDARPMASLQAFVVSFLSPPLLGFDKCEWKSREDERFAEWNFPKKIWRTRENCCLRNLIPFVPFLGKNFDEWWKFVHLWNWKIFELTNTRENSRGHRD